MTAAQEKFLKGSTLSGLLVPCLGEEITVELRNEAFITGKLVQSDGFMSMTLEDVEMVDPAGNKTKFDSFFVHNRLIRYIQLPENLDIESSLESDTLSAGRGRGRGRVGKVSKQRQMIMAKREERRQEDLRNAHKMREKILKERESKQ